MKQIAAGIIMLFMLAWPLFPMVIEKGFCGDSMSITDDIKKIELAEIKCNSEGKDSFGYMPGRIPVLISAPHGAKHYRLSENRWRAEDAFTSSFAIKLAQMTGAHVIYTRNKAQEDPNSDAQCRYKDFLRKVVKEYGIKFIVDIHGAHRNHRFRIDVGTIDSIRERSSCPTFMPVIEAAFRDFDDGIFNKHFAARGSGTITSFAKNELGIEAAQFEISAIYRMVESRSRVSATARDADVLDIMQRMQGMILAINETLNTAMPAVGHAYLRLSGKP